MARPRSFDDDALRAAALQAFWSQGYERTSIGDIAEASGVGNGSIYGAYGSKFGLFLVVFEAYCRSRIDLVRTAMAADGSAADAVRALFDAIVADCATQPGRRGCLMLNSLAEFGEREPRVLELCQQATTGMQSAIEERHVAARVAPDRAELELLAAQILLVTQGLIQASRLHTPAPELRAVAREYEALLPVA
jgi:AcrR family transcriptional regulator